MNRIIPSEEFHRLVVVASNTGADPLLLDAVASMAATHGAEVLALFVEDESLLRSANLPFGREIDVLSGRVRSLDPAEMEQRLRRQAERVRSHLGSASAKHAFHWAFETGRGRPDRVVREFTRPGDVIVLNRSWGGLGGVTGRDALLLLEATRASVMFLGTTARSAPGAVMALQEQRESDGRVMALARRLSGTEGLGLVVAMPPASAKPAADRDAVAPAMALRRAGTRSVKLRGRGLAGLMWTMQRESVRELVIARDSALLGGTTARRLLDAVDATVVVVP